MRKTLRLIHRWLGLFAALWLLLLAVSGLLLQQADWLGLSDRYVSSPTVLKWFDYGRQQQAFDDQQQSLYQIDDVVVFNDFRLPLAEPIVAAGRFQGQWIVVTKNSLYWLNNQGQISRQLDDFDGLPTPVEDLKISNYIVLKSHDRWFELQDDHTFRPTVDSSESESLYKSRPLKGTEKNKIISKALANRLSYDTLLAAVHGGTKGSNWLNTISALALVFLSISGLIMFFKPKRRRRL